METHETTIIRFGRGFSFEHDGSDDPLSVAEKAIALTELDKVNTFVGADKERYGKKTTTSTARAANIG